MPTATRSVASPSAARAAYRATGMALVRRLAEEGERIFTTERARELAPSVGLSEGYLRQALHHLTRAGWLTRLRKGLYALPAALAGGVPPHEFEVAMALVRPAAISHWSALHYHGLSEQTPRRIYVLTTTEASVPRVRGTQGREPGGGYRVGGTIYQFIQVRPERFFGVDWAWIGESRVGVTDPERTLLDGLARPQYCGGFAEVLHAFEVRGPRLARDRIMGYALQLDAAAAKRLGWVLERQGVDLERLTPLAGVPVRGYRPLDPTGPRRGPCDRRWTIQENLPGVQVRTERPTQHPERASA